jgi:hypothetical protein
MSTKFEQLLDLLVNEEMDKANDLFHEIVVEKSRSIYENLIAEEETADDMDESMEDDMDESAEDADDSVEENMDLEDSYSMEADDEAGDEFGGDEEKGGVGGDGEAGGEAAVARGVDGAAGHAAAQLLGRLAQSRLGHLAVAAPRRVEL